MQNPRAFKEHYGVLHFPAESCVCICNPSLWVATSSLAHLSCRSLKGSLLACTYFDCQHAELVIANDPWRMNVSPQDGGRRQEMQEGGREAACGAEVAACHQG